MSFDAKIAILIPCYNEEPTIGKVVDDFRRELPDADIYVYDNNSIDRTSQVAREHGATVRFCRRRGKGMVVRQMFREVSADVYVMVDGDDTYNAKDVHSLLEPVSSGRCDLCLGNRLANFEHGSFGSFHLVGNKIIRSMMSLFFGVGIDDMLSGYRVMTRELVSNLCLISSGFEIETEINIRATWHGSNIACVPTRYTGRPSGSYSKIKLFGDGYRILATMVMLLREYQPMTMAGTVFAIATLLGAAGIAVGVLRDHLYLFLGSIGVVLGGMIVLSVGIVLHSLNMANRESEEHLRKIARLLEAGRREKLGAS